MDILTQGVLGAATAIAVSAKNFGTRKSIVLGFLLGITADLDLFLELFIHHPWLIHRGISHSLFFAPFIAICVALFIFILKKDHCKEWFWLVFFTLITHPLLDLFTSNGTPLLMPFSYHPFALSSIAVVDLHYSLPLFCSIMICWFLKDTNKSVWINASILFITSIYLFSGMVCQDIALKMIEKEKNLSQSLPKDVTCIVGSDLFHIENRYAVCANNNSIYMTHFKVNLFNSQKTESIIWTKKNKDVDIQTKKDANKYAVDKNFYKSFF